jgi:uncharacterized protein (AIM24 family)
MFAMGLGGGGSNSEVSDHTLFVQGNIWAYIRVSGKGSVALKAYGGICRIDLQEGEKYMIHSRSVFVC